MTERGVFAVDRGIWDHPLLDKGEPFTRREAWLWLISEACWKPRTRRVDGKAVEIGRGQIAHSLRFMARAWGWPEPNVRRFLKWLKTDAMIDASTDAGVTVVTVCNYDKYQRVSLPGDAPNDAPNDARPTHDRRKLEDIKDIKEDAAAAAPEISNAEADLFRRGKAVLGNAAGGLIKNLLKAKDGNVALARAAIEQASTKESPREYIGAVVRGNGAAEQRTGAII